MSLTESVSKAPAVQAELSSSFVVPRLTDRQQKIDGLMRAPVAEAQVGRQYSSDITVLIPLHNDTRRYETAELAISSLRNQHVPLEGMHVVIADNGISEEGVSRMRSIGEMNGVDVTFADARATTSEQRSPAYARNQALKRISEWRVQDPKFQGPILEVDSDNVLEEGAASFLQDTLFKHHNAVAVSGEIVPVARLEDHVGMEIKKDGRVRVLPSLWNKNGELDIASIVAFSSQIAGKTTGLMLDPEVLWNITSYSSDLYVQMPGKSAEDMIASAALGRHGAVYQDSRARFYDEARENPSQTRSQQKNWGRDHVHLNDDLAKIGLVSPGIHVLEPQERGWVEWKVPGTEAFSGVIINPADVAATAERLKRELASGSLSRDEGMTMESLKKICTGLRFIERTTDLIDATRPHAEIALRPDLPTPTQEDENSPRFTTAAKTGRLMGNILGISEIHDVKAARHSLPQTFLFGGRQSASY